MLATQMTLDDLRPAGEIQTITVDTYPTRHDARHNPGAWVETTTETGDKHGSLYEPVANPAHPDRTDGICVEVFRHTGIGGFYADCQAYGPNQYGRQNNAHFRTDTYKEAKALAAAWIVTEARPWVAKELANQFDRVEVTDTHGTAHTGHLYGVAADEQRFGTFVKLDNPGAFVGNVSIWETTYVKWDKIRRLPNN